MNINVNGIIAIERILFGIVDFLLLTMYVYIQVKVHLNVDTVTKRKKKKAV